MHENRQKIENQITNNSGQNDTVQHVFIIGAKSIGQYGGFETFVDQLTEQHQNDSSIKYHIACKANGKGAMDESKLKGVIVKRKDKDQVVSEFIYHNAHVFKIKCPDIGPGVALYYDWKAFQYCLNYCERYRIEHPIFYVLTCRIGLFIDPLVRKLHEMGGLYELNPDGNEWKRSKWSRPVRFYWKWSEEKMVKAADVVICDSVNIRNYILKAYHPLHTVYISYGADIRRSTLSDEDFAKWLSEKGLRAGEYYLAVGRFVPENNYEVMIREFMLSSSKKDFVIITNKDRSFSEYLEKKLRFSKDSRIRFVGTVYDRELLKKIRENAYAYIHGHSVGGTNPSLLEALGSTDVNLLYDVGFNREVGADSALYWNKEVGNLKTLIEKTDCMGNAERVNYGKKAKKRIYDYYSWKYIADEYKKMWIYSRESMERRN